MKGDTLIVVSVVAIATVGIAWWIRRDNKQASIIPPNPVLTTTQLRIIEAGALVMHNNFGRPYPIQ